MNAITSLTNKPRLSPQIDPPPMPSLLKELEIPVVVLENLVLKHIAHLMKATVLELSDAMGVSSHIVDELLNYLRKRSLLEVFQPMGLSGSADYGNNQVRYGLSAAGEQEADLAYMKDAYVGPAPVSLDEYSKVVALQDVKVNSIGHEQIAGALRGVFGAEKMIHILGPALNSGRALLLYGKSGTGKSFVAAQLINSFESSVYIPFAVYTSGSIIRVFSDAHHVMLDNNSTVNRIHFNEQYDKRWALCERPNIQVGGELTMEMLEVNHSQHNRVWLAPLQMLANNGLLIIDDLGRQKISVGALLNRWIVPMEYCVDYLQLPNGQQAAIPFTLNLAFSTNLNPLDIGDPAFLRRLGYKIEFYPLSQDEYMSLIDEVAEKRGLIINSESREMVLRLHSVDKTPFYPCIPKDIIGICSDIIKFNQESNVITSSILESAWRLYCTSDGMGGNNE
jgi:predicted ATPase with chaperone activity